MRFGSKSLTISFGSKFLTISILVGITIPALISLFFIYQFSLKTIFWDEWSFVPNLKSFFTGENWFEDVLNSQHNEHRPVFPRFIRLGLAYFTSYNTFYDALLGWTFLGISLFVIWDLLRRTAPEVRWVIIPIAWLLYSVSQFENMLWGFAALPWHLVILSVILTIYFLNKIRDSPFSIVPAIVFGYIASFSSIAGLLVWIVGIFSFRNQHLLKSRYFAGYLITGITAFVIYFNGLKPFPHHPSSLLFLNDPVGFTTYVLTFLGRGLGIARVKWFGISPLVISELVGIVVVLLFVIMSLWYYFRIRHTRNSNIGPWLQVAAFGLLSALIAGIGRVGFGPQQALSPRYIALSNFFLEATIVLTAVVLFHALRTIKIPKHRKILKSFGVMLIILLSINVAMSYTSGWYAGSKWSENINTAGSCLMRFESAPNECLRILHPDPELVKEHARILKDLCLGPFATSECK